MANSATPDDGVTTPADTLVYVRDRSWYESRPSMSHIPRMHRESRNDPGMAACAPFSIMLDEDSKRWASDVPSSLLCRRCFRSPAGDA